MKVKNTIKVLVLFANPKQFNHLELKREYQIIKKAINTAKNRKTIKITFIESSTIQDLRKALLNDVFDIVHISAHGNEFGLILEKENGKPHNIQQEAFAELLSKYRTIKCVILNYCYSKGQGILLSSNLPFIITMQDKLHDSAAIEFSRGFYEAIGAGKNYDFAYEEGVQNVKLTCPNAIFSPNVFSNNSSRREAIYVKDELKPLKEINIEQKSNQLKLGIPPIPDIFLGRDDDLNTIKERLGLIKGGNDTGPTQIIAAQPYLIRNKKSVAALQGLPGIGKTAMATVLTEDKDISQAFPDGVLWASIGQNPSIIHTMAIWAEGLGNDEIYSVPFLKEAVGKLANLLKNKRILMVVDDVYETEHISPFKMVRGNDCSLLITTRAPQVTSELGIPKEAIHKLPPLSENKAMELLEMLAPSVVPEYKKECLELVRIIECLPLAIHVAGRLLNEESQEIWGVKELIKSLQNGKLLIESKAPANLFDLEKQTIPTVATLLKKSVDSLDSEMQLYFAYLAPFAEKPATFDLEDLKACWEIEDPKPIVRQFVKRGLLEAVGDCYQMHSLMVALAESLLQDLSKRFV